MARRPLLGLGGTVDFEIDLDAAVLSDLVREFSIDIGELSRDREISTLRDAVVVMLAHIESGIGGERFLADPGIAHELAARFPHRTTLGGTCTRAALAMHVIGVPSTLHLVSIDDTVRAQLPETIDWICSADRDSLDPHLIVQFPAAFEVRVGDAVVTAPRADRLILANDPPHRELRIAADFGDRAAVADVIVLSSFNVIQEREVLRDRLTTVIDAMQHRQHDAIVLFEDAAYHRPELSAFVREHLVNHVDAWSMNEVEASAVLGHSMPVDDPHEIEAALRELHERIPARVLIVHTAHWAAAVGAGSHHWRDALRMGADLAGCRYRNGDTMTEDDVIAVVEGTRHPDGARIEAALRTVSELVVVAAPAVQTARPTTIGLGDTFVGGMVAALSQGMPALRERWKQPR